MQMLCFFRVCLKLSDVTEAVKVRPLCKSFKNY